MNILSTLLVVLAAAALPAWGAGSVEAGRAAFSPFCGSCHENDPMAARFVPYRFNASGLTAAFRAIPAMNPNIDFLGAQKINDIATYLGVVGLGQPNSNDTDRLLDWGEDTFPALLSPPRQPTQQLSGYTYRFYSATGLYVATKDGRVWSYDSRAPGGAVSDVGTVRSILDLMPNGR